MMKDRRKFARIDLESLAAKIYLEGETHELDFCPVNISKQGFAMICPRQLSPGTHVTMDLYSTKIALVVRWCETNAGNHSFYKVGCEILDLSIDLEKLVQKQLEVEN